MRNFKTVFSIAIIIYCLSVMWRFDEHFFPVVIISLQVMYLILLNNDKYKTF